MLSAAYISAALGNEFKGMKIVYLSQTLRFTAPVYIGDTVTAASTVTNIREDKGIVRLDTMCTNQKGETLVEGEAVIMIMP